MPEFYEPKHFEDNYSHFLEEKLANRSSGRSYDYIDPDCVEDVGKTDFYNDLTDFLNERERSCIEEKDRYLYLPPLEAPGTAKWLENHEEWRGLTDKMDEKKTTVLKNGERLFCLTSDQFGFSAFEGIYEKENYERYPLVNLLCSCREKCKAEQKEVIGRITEYVKNTRTLGGSFLWPVHPEGNKKRECSYNKRRGVGNYLEDRVDLTLLEVKHALDCAGEKKRDYKEYEKSDILYDLYGDDNTHLREWLEHFGTFTEFVEYFMLEPFCKMRPTAEGSYEYIPVNIIDGRGIEEKEETGNTVKVRDLRGKEILNMLDRLEGMILVRTANMERAVCRWRDEFDK